MSVLGFGQQPYGFGPFGSTSTPLTSQGTTAVSSRSIDAPTQRYLQDAYGNPLAMDGTSQRVLLLVSYADQITGIVTPQALRAQEQRIAAALKILLDEGAVSGLSVSVTDRGGPRCETIVSYTNLGTQRAEAVRIS